MKLTNALANFDQTDRLIDGFQIRNAADVVSEVAESDDRQYDLMYFQDGRVAVYRIRQDGSRSEHKRHEPQPAAPLRVRWLRLRAHR